MTPRWCPSCRREWPEGAVACRECFVDLVEQEALTATSRCRHCGRDWPARMQSCPECLSELRPDPVRAHDMLAATLARGFYLARPDGQVPFLSGPGCVLLRARPHSSLVFVGDDGFLEAHVDGRDHRAEPPLACRTLDGDVLFRLARYRAAADGLVAYGTDGAPLGTWLRRPGAIHPVVDVRDETSAPVATLRVSPPGAGHGFDLVETGGVAVAAVSMADVENEGWIDDQWSLRLLADPDDLPLRPLALVAGLLAAKILLGRATPARVQSPGRAELEMFDDGTGS